MSCVFHESGVRRGMCWGDAIGVAGADWAIRRDATAVDDDAWLGNDDRFCREDDRDGGNEVPPPTCDRSWRDVEQDGGSDAAETAYDDRPPGPLLGRRNGLPPARRPIKLRLVDESDCEVGVGGSRRGDWGGVDDDLRRSILANITSNNNNYYRKVIVKRRLITKVMRLNFVWTKLAALSSKQLINFIFDSTWKHLGSFRFFFIFCGVNNFELNSSVFV